MLPGQYVVHAGRIHQINKIARSAICGPRGMPIPSTLYYLVDVETRLMTFAEYPSRTLNDPVTNPPPDLLPACEACKTAPGWPCHHTVPSVVPASVVAA